MRSGLPEGMPTQLALVASTIKCAMVRAIVAIRRAAQLTGAGPFQPVSAQATEGCRIVVFCRYILRRSGPGVEPSQRGVATPHRF